MNTFRVVGNGLPHETRIFYNDVDITNSIQSVYIKMGFDMVPHIHIDCIGLIDIPEMLQALVDATVQEPASEDEE